MKAKVLSHTPLALAGKESLPPLPPTRCEHCKFGSAVGSAVPPLLSVVEATRSRDRRCWWHLPPVDAARRAGCGAAKHLANPLRGVAVGPAEALATAASAIPH